MTVSVDQVVPPSSLRNTMTRVHGVAKWISEVRIARNRDPSTWSTSRLLFACPSGASAGMPGPGRTRWVAPIDTGGGSMVAGGTGGGAQAAIAMAALSMVATAEVERVSADIPQYYTHD